MQKRVFSSVTTEVTEVDEVLKMFDNSHENLIQIMLELQKRSGKNYLPSNWVEKVATELKIPMNKVYEVITFYSMFSTKPKGKYVIEVCKSGPCKVTGANNILNMLEALLEIKLGETTKDGLFTIEHANCFGACDISPAIKIGEKVFGYLTQEKLLDIIHSCKEGECYERKC